MNAVVCLDMAGVNTIIKNPETKEPKTFAFDFSYWSDIGRGEGRGGADGGRVDDWARLWLSRRSLGPLVSIAVSACVCVVVRCAGRTTVSTRVPTAS